MPAYLKKLQETPGNSLNGQMQQIVRLCVESSTGERMTQAKSSALQYRSFDSNVFYRTFRKQ
jgi:hypothetical protein